jgi:hypothetical protein
LIELLNYQMSLANYNAIFGAIIFVMVHSTIFVSDAITNNFFPFRQIFGVAVHQDLETGKYHDLNYSYSCDSTRSCSRELCKASSILRANRVILMPIFSSRDCSVPDTAWVATMTTVLAVEWLLTILWIGRKKLCLLCSWMEDKMSAMLLFYYLAVSFIYLWWGPTSLIVAISNQVEGLWAVLTLRYGLFAVLWNHIFYNLCNQETEEKQILRVNTSIEYSDTAP